MKEFLSYSMTEDRIEHQERYWEKKRRSPTHPVIEAFVGPKIDYIRNYVDLLENTKLLDVGCGNGFFTYYFSEIVSSVGLDYSRYMLSINPCNLLVQGSAVFLPFTDNTFDIVFCSSLLHHVKHPTIVLREMKRVSKNFVILFEPNRNNPFVLLFSTIVREERSALTFSLRYMERLVERCGLKTVASCGMGSIAPNKTPFFLLKWFRRIDCRTPFGLDNLVISHK